MNKKIIWGIVIVAIAIVAGYLYIDASMKSEFTKNEVIHLELVSKYEMLKDNAYLKTESRRTNLETEIEICDSQRFINYSGKYESRSNPLTGKWLRVTVIDCGSTYYIGEISDSGSRLFGPFQKNNNNVVTSPDPVVEVKTVYAPEINITSINPTSGSVGTIVVVNGSGFVKGLTHVGGFGLGTLSDEPNITSTTTLTFKIPQHLSPGKYTFGLYTSAKYTPESNDVEFTVTK